MRAAPILAVVLATLAAAPAGAFEELPFRTLPGSSPASCLRATGADGGLGTLGPDVDLTTPVDLLAAAGPPAVRARARFAIVISCPVLREQGAAAVAAVPDPLAPVAATGSLTEGFGAVTVLGSPVRATESVTALLLAGGEPAVAWADNATALTGLGDSAPETSLRDGRIHLPRAGTAAAPAARPPAVRLRAPRVQRLRLAQGVRLRVRCAAACDVRALLPGTDGLLAGQGASLPGAGARDLRIEPAISALVSRRPRRVVVRVRVAAPGSPVARTLRLPLRLVRR